MLASAEKVLTPASSSFRFWKRSEAAFDFSWHFHAEIELTLILAGRGKRFVGDHEAPYGPGDLVLVGPNLPHSWAADSAGGRRHEALVLQIPANFLGDALERAPELASLKRLWERSGGGLHFKGAAAARAAKALNAAFQKKGLAQLTGVLSVLGQLAASKQARALNPEQYVPSLRLSDQSRIDAACAYLNEHFQEELSLAKLAERAHMSAPAFSRYFAKKTRQTFVAYVRDRRLGLACKRLLETDKTVTEICHECGFNNLSNFNRQFRKLKKVSPQRFRQDFIEQR